METRNWCRLSAEKNKFKSYYVVWKHRYRGEAMADARLFKSYYVVWKRKYSLYIALWEGEV